MVAGDRLEQRVTLGGALIDPSTRGATASRSCVRGQEREDEQFVRRSRAWVIRTNSFACFERADIEAGGPPAQVSAISAISAPSLSAVQSLYRT